MLKGFHYVPAHRSFGIKGKITYKYVTKGVKVTQKLVEIASHWNLKSASIVMLDISPWD